MARRFAEGTKVPVSRSMNELHGLLGRFGATTFVQGLCFEPPAAWLAFEVEGRTYRLSVPLPAPEEVELTPSGLRRGPEGQQAALNRELKRRWRVLVHVVKALLVAVQEGVWPFEVAMQPFLLLPDQRTVQEALAAQVDRLLEGGAIPLLPRRSGDELG